MKFTQKQVEVFKKVYLASENGKLEWQEVENQTYFQTNFPNASARIDCTKDLRTKANKYTLTVLNSKGQVVESVDSEALSSTYEKPKEKLEELYVMARRSALGADKTINHILETLTGF